MTHVTMTFWPENEHAAIIALVECFVSVSWRSNDSKIDMVKQELVWDVTTPWPA